MKPAARHRVVGLHAQLPGGTEHHEVLVGHLVEADLRPGGEAVVQRDGQDERLREQTLPAHALLPGLPGGELEVELAVDEHHRPAGVVGGEQPEAHPGMVTAEGVDEVRHQPGPQGQLERDRDRPGLRVDQLVDRREAVVQVVEGGVDVPLEHRSGVGGPQHPTAAQQQRRAHLLLEPRQGAGDAGLADLVELGHLGDGRAVRHQLEPAQGLHVHSHDARAWIAVQTNIGRMDQEVKRFFHDVHTQGQARSSGRTTGSPSRPQDRAAPRPDRG